MRMPLPGPHPRLPSLPTGNSKFVVTAPLVSSTLCSCDFWMSQGEKSSSVCVPGLLSLALYTQNTGCYWFCFYWESLSRTSSNAPFHLFDSNLGDSCAPGEAQFPTKTQKVGSPCESCLSPGPPWNSFETGSSLKGYVYELFKNILWGLGISKESPANRGAGAVNDVHLHLTHHHLPTSLPGVSTGIPAPILMAPHCQTAEDVTSVHPNAAGWDVLWF